MSICDIYCLAIARGNSLPCQTHSRKLIVGAILVRLCPLYLRLSLPKQEPGTHMMCGYFPIQKLISWRRQSRDLATTAATDLFMQYGSVITRHANVKFGYNELVHAFSRCPRHSWRTWRCARGHGQRSSSDPTLTRNTKSHLTNFIIVSGHGKRHTRLLDSYD